MDRGIKLFLERACSPHAPLVTCKFNCHVSPLFPSPCSYCCVLYDLWGMSVLLLPAVVHSRYPRQFASTVAHLRHDSSLQDLSIELSPVKSIYESDKCRHLRFGGKVVGIALMQPFDRIWWDSWQQFTTCSQENWMPSSHGTCIEVASSLSPRL